MLFTHWSCQKTWKDIAEYFHILAVLPIYIKECLWEWTSDHPYGNHTLMWSWTVFRARNTVKHYGWSFTIYLIKGSTHEQTRRPAGSVIKEWVENITKEVSII